MLIEKNLKAVESKLNADAYYLANPTSKQSILNVERKHLEKKINKIAKSPGKTKLQKLKEMDKVLDRAEKRHYK